MQTVTFFLFLVSLVHVYTKQSDIQIIRANDSYALLGSYILITSR